jgi:hypothetical protein
MSLLVWLYVLYPEALGNSLTHAQLSLQYMFGLEIIMYLCILSFAYAAVLRPVEVSSNRGIACGYYQLNFSVCLLTNVNFNQPNSFCTIISSCILCKLLQESLVVGFCMKMSIDCFPAYSKKNDFLSSKFLFH